MKIVCEMHGIVDYQRPGQGVLDIEKSGFNNISFDIMNTYKLDGKNKIENLFEEYKTDKQILKRISASALNCITHSNLKLHSIRSPHLPINTTNTDLNISQKLMTSETIHICGDNNCKYVIASPIFAWIKKSDLWNENKKFLLSLAQIAKENDVTILIENQCKYYNGQFVRGLFSDEIEASVFIDELNQIVNEERFGFCMNVANCNLCGMDMHNFAVAMGKRIKAVVISDCDGHNDTHLLPFTAVNKGALTDWLSLIRGLREAQFEGSIILDFADTAMSFSPILRPQLMSLAKSVADYFKWQLEIELLLKKYNKIVLFGAGNMCRNYMKCYGEKYPPLFTCDNNSKIWGTMFCGLEVKNPEELKRIPDDCAIFICNIFYREIEQQLRDMGITNPIEYFNDEYMPSFYFDRLKG